MGPMPTYLDQLQDDAIAANRAGDHDAAVRFFDEWERERQRQAERDAVTARCRADLRDALAPVHRLVDWLARRLNR